MIPLHTSSKTSKIKQSIKDTFIGCTTVKKSTGMSITKVRKVITSREREEEAIGEGHIGDF